MSDSSDVLQALIVSRILDLEDDLGNLERRAGDPGRDVRLPWKLIPHRDPQTLLITDVDLIPVPPTSIDGSDA